MPTSTIPLIIFSTIILYLFGLIFIREDIFLMRYIFILTLISIIEFILLLILLSLVILDNLEFKLNINSFRHNFSIFFAFISFLFIPIYISFMFVRQSIGIYENIDLTIKKELEKNYFSCLNNLNCQNSFANKLKNRPFQISVDKNCLIAKPLHNFDFLYYEFEKCSEKILEHKHYSALKFMKNVLLLKFKDIF